MINISLFSSQGDDAIFHHSFIENNNERKADAFGEFILAFVSQMARLDF